MPLRRYIVIKPDGAEGQEFEVDLNLRSRRHALLGDNGRRNAHESGEKHSGESPVCSPV